jgi:hypothetical protein
MRHQRSQLTLHVLGRGQPHLQALLFQSPSKATDGGAGGRLWPGVKTATVLEAAVRELLRRPQPPPCNSPVQGVGRSALGHEGWV